jgi:hypothetical protein
MIEKLKYIMTGISLPTILGLLFICLLQWNLKYLFSFQLSLCYSILLFIIFSIIFYWLISKTRSNDMKDKILTVLIATLGIGLIIMFGMGIIEKIKAAFEIDFKTGAFLLLILLIMSYFFFKDKFKS